MNLSFRVTDICHPILRMVGHWLTSSFLMGILRMYRVSLSWTDVFRDRDLYEKIAIFFSLYLIGGSLKVQLRVDE